MSEPTKIRYVERQTFIQKPDVYDGPKGNGHRPRWMTSYPKEGEEEDGETLKIDLPGAMMPPGSRVTIEVPVCPKCGTPSDMNGSDGKRHKKWPNCVCVFLRRFSFVLLFRRLFFSDINIFVSRYYTNGVMDSPPT
jgi:hypothetical protein